MQYLTNAGTKLSLLHNRRGNYHHIWQMEKYAMNHEAILAVLPDSKDDALSLKEIARALGLEMNSYVDWIRAERRLSNSLRALARWGWVASDRRQNEDGHRFWYNAYWKTEPVEAKAVVYDPP